MNLTVLLPRQFSHLSDDRLFGFNSTTFGYQSPPFSLLLPITTMLYPVDACRRNPFSPIRFEPATSFTQNIPPEKDVNCLLLGCGDPRNILFTVFGDEDTGKQVLELNADGIDSPRNFDFTCCDVEPAIIGNCPLLSR